MYKKLFNKIFLFILLGALVSCDESFRSSIPTLPVNFSCSLAQHPYNIITTPGQFLTVTKKGSAFVVSSPGIDNYTDGRTGVYLGYGGLIIGYPAIDLGGGSKFVAYDRACPYEADDLEKSLLNINTTHEAICPTCKTIYDLNSGFPKKGVSKERLKTYNISVSGTELIIRN